MCVATTHREDAEFGMIPEPCAELRVSLIPYIPLMLSGSTCRALTVDRGSVERSNKHRECPTYLIVFVGPIIFRHSAIAWSFPSTMAVIGPLH